MKLVKLSVFALAMGLCVASCGGNSEETTTTTEDTTVIAPEVTPAVDTVVAPMDSTAVMADTAAKM